MPCRSTTSPGIARRRARWSTRSGSIIERARGHAKRPAPPRIGARPPVRAGSLRARRHGAARRPGGGAGRRVVRRRRRRRRERMDAHPRRGAAERARRYGAPPDRRRPHRGGHRRDHRLAHRDLPVSRPGPVRLGAALAARDADLHRRLLLGRHPRFVRTGAERIPPCVRIHQPPRLLVPRDPLALRRRVRHGHGALPLRLPVRARGLPDAVVGRARRRPHARRLAQRGLLPHRASRSRGRRSRSGSRSP